MYSKGNSIRFHFVDDWHSITIWEGKTMLVCWTQRRFVPSTRTKIDWMDTCDVAFNVRIEIKKNIEWNRKTTKKKLLNTYTQSFSIITLNALQEHKNGIIPFNSFLSFPILFFVFFLFLFFHLFTICSLTTRMQRRSWCN